MKGRIKISSRSLHRNTSQPNRLSSPTHPSALLTHITPAIILFLTALVFINYQPLAKASCSGAFGKRDLISQDARKALQSRETFQVLTGGERLTQDSRELLRGELKGENAKGQLEIEWRSPELKLPWDRFPGRNPQATLLDQLSQGQLKFPTQDKPLDHLILQRDFAPERPTQSDKNSGAKDRGTPRIEDQLLRSKRREKRPSREENSKDQDLQTNDLVVARYRDRVEIFERDGSKLSKESMYVWTSGDGSSPLSMELSPGGDFLLFRSTNGAAEVVSTKTFESILRSERSLDRELKVFEDTNGYPLILEIKASRKAMEVFEVEPDGLISTGYKKTFEKPVDQVVIPSRKSPEIAMLIFDPKTFKEGSYSRRESLGPHFKFVALREDLLEDSNWNPGDVLSTGPQKPKKPIRPPIDSRTNDPSLKNLSEGKRREKAREAQEEQFQKSMREYEAQLEAWQKSQEKQVITTVIDGDIGNMLRKGDVFDAPLGEIPLTGALSKYFARSPEGVGAVATKEGVYLFDAAQKVHWRIQLRSAKNAEKTDKEEVINLQFVTPAHLKGLEAPAPLLLIHARGKDAKNLESRDQVYVYQYRGADTKPSLLFKVKAPENIDAFRITEQLDYIDFIGENGKRVQTLKMLSESGELMVEKESVRN